MEICLVVDIDIIVILVSAMCESSICLCFVGLSCLLSNWSIGVIFADVVPREVKMFGNSVASIIVNVESVYVLNRLPSVCVVSPT